MRRFWQQQVAQRRSQQPHRTATSSNRSSRNSPSSSNSSSSVASAPRFRSRSHSADFGTDNPAAAASLHQASFSDKQISEHAHEEMPPPTPCVSPINSLTNTPAPSPANSPPSTPVNRPLMSRLDRVPPLSGATRLTKAVTSSYHQKHVHRAAPAPMRPHDLRSAPTTIQRSQTPGPQLSTGFHSSLGMHPSSSSACSNSSSSCASSSSSASPSIVRPRKHVRGCGWSPRPRDVVLPRALERSRHTQFSTHCHNTPSPSSNTYSMTSCSEPFDHTKCAGLTGDAAGPRAVAVRTIRQGPYQKLCIDPDGTQYILKDDYAAIEIWHANSDTPSTLNLTGRIGTVRGMVWCNNRIYMTDWMYSNILEVNLTDGRVKRFVGLCQHGSMDGNHLLAQFNRPWGIHADMEGQCLYVADCANNRIRRVCLRTRHVTSIAGSGARGHSDGVPGSASFYRPSGIAVSADHSVYITEFSSVRQVTHTGVTGGGSSSAGSASMMGTGSNLFLRKCFAAADSGDQLNFDQVSTVTGNGRQITSSDTQLHRPRYMVETSDGSLVVADCGHFRVRIVSPDRRSIKTIAGCGTERSVDMNLTRSSQRMSGKSNHAEASFQWIYSMALCQHSDTLYVVQDDGCLREVQLKFPPCITDRVTTGILESDIGKSVPTDLVRLIQQFCYR